LKAAVRISLPAFVNRSHDVVATQASVDARNIER